MEYQKIEECIQKKNDLFEIDEKDVMQYANRVEEANKEAIFVSRVFEHCSMNNLNFYALKNAG